MLIYLCIINFQDKKISNFPIIIITIPPYNIDFINMFFSMVIVQWFLIMIRIFFLNFPEKYIEFGFIPFQNLQLFNNKAALVPKIFKYFYFWKEFLFFIICSIFELIILLCLCSSIFCSSFLSHRISLFFSYFIFFISDLKLAHFFSHSSRGAALPGDPHIASPNLCISEEAAWFSSFRAAMELDIFTIP